MIVVQVTVRAKPDDAARLEETLREIFIYAEFESDEAFARYRKGPVLRMIGERLLPLLEGRPSFKHLSATVLEES